VWAFLEKKWWYLIPAFIGVVLSFPIGIVMNLLDGTVLHHTIALLVPPLAIAGVWLLERFMFKGMRRALVVLYGVIVGCITLQFTNNLMLPYAIIGIGVLCAVLLPINVQNVMAIRGYKPVMYGALIASFLNVVLYVWLGSGNVIVGGKETASTLLESSHPEFTYLHHVNDNETTPNTQLAWYTNNMSNMKVHNIALPKDSADVGTIAEISSTGARNVVYYHPDISDATTTLVRASFAPWYDISVDTPHYTLFTLR
jgi:hypothetical protein